MKFCKKYEEYMQGQGGKKKLPGVGFKKLKKILKKCRKQPNSQTLIDYQNNDNNNNNDDDDNDDNDGDLIPYDHISTCPKHCSVCDGTFFPALLEEMSAVVGSFNERAQRLIELHMASGLSKCAFWLKGKLQRNHIVKLTQEGRDLVNYAVFNAIAMRKILKKYDKVHYSKQGQAFKSQARSMRIEILQSPLLCELMAFHINLQLLTTSKVNNPRPAPILLEGCSLVVRNDDDANPSLHCELFDSAKLDTDLTCSICLETLFDPVSLTCGHMFCYFCACKAASVTIVDGLKAAKPDNKCPMCREGGVYKGAVHLGEMHIMIRRSCPGYWKERRELEKRERVKQAKEHWESQCRLFAGV